MVLCCDVQEEREEEEILLQPIGPGVQTLESDGSGTLRQRSLTPVVLPEQQGTNTQRRQIACNVSLVRTEHPRLQSIMHIIYRLLKSHSEYENIT